MTALPDIAGCVEARTARSTGLPVLLIDLRGEGAWAGTEEEGRWLTLCDTHGGLLQHSTRQDARGWMAAPEDWCPECMPAQ